MSNPEVSEVSHKGEEEEESKECQETMEEPKEGGGGQQLESVGEENSPEPEPKPKPAAKSAADVRKERMERLRTLHLRRNEARKLNHAEVVEEDRQKKLPANWEARKRKLDWEIADEEARKQAELEGVDYEKQKLLETSASELERRERKRKKKNPDTGFADFAQAQHRQYERLTKQMDPNMSAYEKQKEEMGETFYPGVNTLIQGNKPSEAAIDRMVEDLEKQIDKRSKYSRRRGHNEDSDVDYINDRNMRFNKKAARFYDQYTAEIKQNLERGTAV